MIDLGNSKFARFRHYVFFENEEYHPDAKNYWQGRSDGILRNCIRLFEGGGKLLNAIPRPQLYEGFDFISGGCGFFRVPADPMASWVLREGFYLSMVSLFRDLFAIDPLGTVAFAWFERTTVWCVDGKGRAAVDDPGIRQAMLLSLGRILELPSSVCQRAALHGLNHIHHWEPEAAEEVIDQFLDRGGPVDAAVHEDALLYRDGRQP